MAFEAIKDAISNANIIRYYDLCKPSTWEINAILHGLGAILLKRGPPNFSSKSLHPPQKAYVAM